jgi:cell division protein FtsB
MQHQVGEILLAASKGLAQTVAQQEDIVGKLEDEVQRLSTEVKDAIQGTSPNTK